MNTDEYHVINRNGDSVPLDFNKILLRLTKLKEIKPVLHVNIGLIAQNTIRLMANNITTIELDNISANFCASMITTHPDYGTLASRIEIDNLHRETLDDYYETVVNINNYIIDNIKNIILDEKLVKFVKNYNLDISKIINYQNDYNFTYFGIKTLKKAYLVKHIINNTNKILERPQHMWMRVSIGINLNKILEDGSTDENTLNDIFETYEQLSNNYYIHATPTLFNAGTKRQSLSSCFLLNVDDDLEGIYKTLSDTAKISKWSGGIGIHVSQVRSKDSIIHSTNGKSEGIVPMLKVFNDSALYVSQGGGKRRGSTSVYLEPWHADIEGFLDLKKPIGDEMLRARDLFLALWIPDLFMKRLEIAIKTNKEVLWSLFCPNKAKGLTDVYGDEFEKLYISYENKKIFNKQISIIKLWKHILEIQMESGVPYIMYKDAVNRKSNQNNLGTIKSSNLCSEICIYTDSKQIGVCNLASISLPKFVETNEIGETIYNYKKLYDTVRIATKNLNKVIDSNVYPVKEGQYSDSRNRPIAVGVQGLADVFFKLKLPFTSNEAKEVNKLIAETIYYASLTESNAIATKLNKTYETYSTSMSKNGILQYDLWNVTPSNLWNWNELKAKIKNTGLYNSLLVALMPTASTSNIMGNYEMFEPITSNMFIRSTLSGTFQIINKYLINDLIELNLWNDNLKQQIIAHDGSVQNIKEIPQNIKEIYKTVWEIKQKDLIDMDRDRGAFVCHSSSSNRYVKDPTDNKLTSMHMYCFKQGLKTSSYYLRTQGVSAVKFNVDVNILKQMKMDKLIEDAKNAEDQEDCLVCSA
jgi:ribonucleoside-diphosphate reductase alpha chain